MLKSAVQRKAVSLFHLFSGPLSSVMWCENDNFRVVLKDSALPSVAKRKRAEGLLKNSRVEKGWINLAKDTESR